MYSELSFDATERRIADTFLELISEVRYNSIKVNYLASKCGIARTTFYRYYSDIFDLLEKIERYLLRNLVLFDTDSHRRHDPGFRAFESIESWFERGLSLGFILRPLMGENGDPYFSKRLQAKLEVELGAMMMYEKLPKSDELRSYSIAMLSGSYVALLRYAVTKETPSITAKDLATLANANRISYFKFYEGAPPISNEQLFGYPDDR